MNILEKKKKISKNQQKINSIKKNGKSANEHLTQTVSSTLLYLTEMLCIIIIKGESHHGDSAILGGIALGGQQNCWECIR